MKKISCWICVIESLRSRKKPVEELIDISRCKVEMLVGYLSIECPRCKNHIYVKRDRDE